MQYTNKSFFNYVQQTFTEPYNFGIHNINLDCYKSVVRKDNRYIVHSKDITAINIANNILKKGLFVYEKDRGLTSTVAFIDHKYRNNKNLNEINPNILNYNFQTKEEESFKKIINIFVAILNFLLLEGKEYFIGSLNYPINIGNKILFHSILPNEFIYGYYIKKVSFNPYALHDIEYKEDLEFTLNKNHIILKSMEEKEIITKSLLKTIRQEPFLLETINNYDKIKNILKQTREQEEKFKQMMKTK